MNDFPVNKRTLVFLSDEGPRAHENEEVRKIREQILNAMAAAYKQKMQRQCEKPEPHDETEHS